MNWRCIGQVVQYFARAKAAAAAAARAWGGGGAGPLGRPLVIALPVITVSHRLFRA